MEILGTIKLEKLTTYKRTTAEYENLLYSTNQMTYPIDFIKQYEEDEIEIASCGTVLKPNMIYKMYGKGKFGENEQLQFNDQLLHYGISGKVASIKDPDEDGYREVCIIAEAIEPVIVYNNIDLLWIVGEPSDSIPEEIIINTEEDDDAGASENI